MLRERRRGGGPAAVCAAVLALAGGCRAQQPGTPAASTRDAWAGTRWPPPPGEVVIERGTTLGTADTASFALAEVAAGGERLLWLGRRAGERAGEATWTVTDALALPPLGSGRRLMLALCGGGVRSGASAAPEDVVLDPEIVAVARAASAPVLRRIDAAWRANRLTGRFESIPAPGIACLNDVEPD